MHQVFRQMKGAQFLRLLSFFCCFFNENFPKTDLDVITMEMVEASKHWGQPFHYYIVIVESWTKPTVHGEVDFFFILQRVCVLKVRL